jgi:hypothetical protein
VEKKLLTLWSELLDMVEENIDNEDSFFVSDRLKFSIIGLTTFSNSEEILSSPCDLLERRVKRDCR